MSSLKFARAALRASRPAAAPVPRTTAPTVPRRGYADVASDKIQLNLALPHQVCLLRSHLGHHRLCKRERPSLTRVPNPVDLQVHGCVRSLSRLQLAFYNLPMEKRSLGFTGARGQQRQDPAKTFYDLQSPSQYSRRIRRDGHPLATCPFD